MSRLRRSEPRPRQGDEKAPPPAGAPTLVTPALLRAWPLPLPEKEGDKEARGRVLVAGGSREMPGALLLAAEAALRAGAGKLRVAAPESIAGGVALAVPEGRVFALPEVEETGAVAPEAAGELSERGNEVAALLLGPGMLDEERTAALVREVLGRLAGVTVVLDAAALACLAADTELLHRLGGNCIITPHAGEMASCLGVPKEEISADPVQTARHAAERFRAVVVLKGAETIIAGVDGECYRNRAGNVGLATSGSGDTLAGIIAGLAARGASPLQAAVWGVALHARAGDRLARTVGPLGFLARELLAEVPGLMKALGAKR